MEFKVGDSVRFSKRTQMYPYMTIEAVDYLPLLGDTLYKLAAVSGWWSAGSLEKFDK
jgi:hypothetical protein